MKIVYMGTPDFAVPPLAALVQNGYEVTAVVTQPDKPKGRGKTLLPTPVKEEAMKHDIPVYQPIKVREPEFVGGGLCVAARRLSSLGDAVLTIHQEHRAAQPPHPGAGQGPLRDDGRLDVGHDPRS